MIARRAIAVLEERVDAASLGAFRIAYGALMLIAIVRFAAMGWIDELYVRPALHFTFWGFSWVRVLPPPAMYALFALLGACAILTTLGVLHRAATATLVIGFSYLELIDATYYLNHHWAMILFGALLAVLPADRALSLRGAPPQPSHVPFAAIAILRAQLAIVYVFAGIAKLGEDWLVRGEPLRTWLLARTDLPLVGPLFAAPHTAVIASWAGALFDLAIPFLLLSRRARGPAYALVIVFHLATAVLFRPIGMFPWLMIALTPIFFSPGWPRRAPIAIDARTRTTLPRPALAALGAWLAIQIALPLRHHAYEGDRLWTGEGMRFAWHVMIAERAGSLELRAVDEHGRSWRIDPSRELDPRQLRMIALEPDLLIQYARHVRDDFARRGHRVRVFADVWVSLHGRPAQRLVNPGIDLASEEAGIGGYQRILMATEDGRGST